MVKKLQVISICAALALVACSGDKSQKVQALQKKDKNLSCSEVMLELNEAEFYRKTAEKNKGPGIKSILMPLGYVSTYIDADEAADAANARMDYLNRIYEILQCDQRSGLGHEREASNTKGGYYVPNGYYPSNNGEPAEPINSEANIYYAPGPNYYGQGDSVPMPQAAPMFNNRYTNQDMM